MIKSPKPKQHLREFCKEILGLSQSIRRHSAEGHHQARIGEKIFRLHFQNSAMADIMFPPIEHLQVSYDKPPDVSVDIWDSKSAKINLPEIELINTLNSLKLTKGSHDGETIFYNDQNYTLAFQVPRQHLSIADHKTGQSVFWVPAIDNLYPLDGRPFRAIFQWFLSQGNNQIVHAAGVGLQHGGVIITGKSGAGKSTIAVACLNSSLKLAGDENVIVSANATPVVHSLYNSANLDNKSLSLLPFMKRKQVPAIEDSIDKTLFYLHQSFPDKFISHFNLKAIVVSQVSGTGSSRLEQLSPAAALTSLAPTSIFQIPGNKQTAFFRMSQFVKKTPCFQLSIGGSMNDVPPILIKLINDYHLDNVNE